MSSPTVTTPRPPRASTASRGDAAVAVSHLRKAYGQTLAVEDLSMSIAEGELFGILGPNGAGKTTTVECIIGLRRPDAGSVSVLGLDPTRDRARLRLLLGAQLQSSALPAKLTVAEILDLYRSFYRHPADVSELVDALGLGEKLGSFHRALSGGEKQRLSVALALVGAPRVAVLDEMTTGLDPEARRDAWQAIERVRDRGVTIVLVTHFMEEAQRLCDRVAVIARGRLVALDTPDRLAAESTGKRVRFVASRSFDDGLLTHLPEVGSVTRDGPVVTVTGTGELVNVVILTLAAAGVTARDVALDSATLEDAFVRLTGETRDSRAAR